MKLETRIDNMKYYLEEAIKNNDPSDKLYIEDLKLSIAFAEASLNKVIPIMNGIVLD